jgi:ribosome silencing factor RsfS/YbeB/iojap
VPTGQPWLKGREVSTGEDRYLMTVVATAANPRFSVSRVDIDRAGPTYTKDTLKDLQALNADSELYFITGADALASILSWQDLDELFAAARFVGVSRPGYELGSEHLAGVLDGLPEDALLPVARRERPPAVVPDARRRRAVHLQARSLRQAGGADVTAAPEAIDMAVVAARAAAAKLADDVVVIDVSDQLVITDCFVIASASNERQVNAIVDEVEAKMREAGYKPARREGTREGRWTLLDYVDIVVHIQHQDERDFYALDRLWRDCPVVAVDLS